MSILPHHSPFLPPTSVKWVRLQESDTGATHQTTTWIDVGRRSIEATQLHHSGQFSKVRQTSGSTYTQHRSHSIYYQRLQVQSARFHVERADENPVSQWSLLTYCSCSKGKHFSPVSRFLSASSYKPPRSKSWVGSDSLR